MTNQQQPKGLYEIFRPTSGVKPPVTDTEFRQRIAKMPKKYQYIANVMRSGNVPFLQGYPGTAKSAIYKFIADTLGMQFIVLWLSRGDEADFSLPHAVNGDEYSIHRMTVPEWALASNQMPTVLLFEELNRCSTGMMNACLGILQERTLGFGFSFNQNVWMGACGNMGEADGTVVNELDTAAITRLVTIKHHLEAKEWLDVFALVKNAEGVQNVHPILCQYIEAKPGMIYRLDKKTTDDSGMIRPYPNPRTYHNLSKYLMLAVGPEAGFAEVLPELVEHGIDFVGKDITDLIKWCEDNSMLTIKDVLERYDQVRGQIKAPRIPEFFKDLKGLKWTNLSEKQIGNLRDFFQDVEKKKMYDQLMAYFQECVTKTDNKTLSEMMEKSPTHRDFLKVFKTYILEAHKKATGTADKDAAKK